MKHLRVTVRVDPDQAPPFFELLADAPAVAEARLLDMTTTAEEGTLLFSIDGDPSTFAERATETAGIESVEVAAGGPGPAYALVAMQIPAVPVFDGIHRASTRHGLVVRTPVVYRDGEMHGRAVGDPEPLQRALGDLPESVDVGIDELGRFRGRLEDPRTRLSERQLEALEAAAALGYYDQPRGATHEDVAAELGCAPTTASDHLQNAEAKLVAAVLDEFGPRV